MMYKIEQKRFWTKEQSKHYTSAQRLLVHAILDGLELKLFQGLKKCYLLEPGTLLEFACGVHFELPVEWLIVPYHTGYDSLALFDESVFNNGKSIYSPVVLQAAEAIPYITFFGLDNLAGKENLFITESPFETMLLWQYLQHEDDLDGDVIGFIPNKEMAPYPTGLQLNLLKEMFDGRYKRIYLIMNDKPSLVMRVMNHAIKCTKNTEGVSLYAVDTVELTGRKFRTYLDVMKHPEQIDFAEPLHKALLV